MENVYFTSDTHFGHTNIIKYSNRPFLNSEEMDEAMIINWNKTVGPNDIVWHLGDFAWYRVNRIIAILRRLICKRIYFIYGNHDKDMEELDDMIYFGNAPKDIADKIKFKGNLVHTRINGQNVSLCHYAMRTWDKSHHTAWQLYGHSHSSLPDDPTARAIDVGVDCHNYRPIHFDEVATIMAKKNWVPIDHHGAKQEGGGVGLDKEAYAKALRQQQYEMLKKEFAP